MTLKAALLAMLATGTAIAAEPPLPIEKKPAMMLYFGKTFGAARARDELPLAFGLRLQSTPFARGPAATMFDLRHHVGLGATFATGGAPVWVSKSLATHPRYAAAANFSSGEDSWGNPLTYVLLGAVIVGGMCVAEAGICEDDDGEDGYTPPVGMGASQ